MSRLQLTRYQRAFLGRVRAGDVPELVRAFPRPHRLQFRTATGPVSDGASERVLQSLLRRGLVEASPQDPQWDHVVYRLTARGAALVERMRAPSETV